MWLAESESESESDAASLSAGASARKRGIWFGKKRSAISTCASQMVVPIFPAEKLRNVEKVQQRE